MDKAIVITTINAKTKALTEFERREGWHVIVVGDRKSQPIESTETLTFLSVEDQRGLGFSLVEACPYDHYTRKNIGYLYALQHGAKIIYDTDDDNLPYESWGVPDFSCSRQLSSESSFANVYRYFTDEHVWPRGYPLQNIQNDDGFTVVEDGTLDVGIWQGLADREPDVDAIFRLVFGKEITFEDRPPVALPDGLYCPFNSQNTFWTEAAFPYLYLPATVTFRFTDILRGYVAQRLMWDQNLHLGFTDATVYQDRNVHDLMRDFESEVDCYLAVKQIAEKMATSSFTGNPLTRLKQVYQQLHADGHVTDTELELLDAWTSDFRKARAS